MPEKTRIAILGGGMASLVTAFELTRTPELRSKFEIVIYQQGHRLGGKGASSRNLERGRGKRIEEHGFHVFMGFYERTLGVLETCYTELGQAQCPGLAFPTLKAALTPRDKISFLEADGVWTFSSANFGAQSATTPKGRLDLARKVLQPMAEPTLAEKVKDFVDHLNTLDDDQAFPHEFRSDRAWKHFAESVYPQVALGLLDHVQHEDGELDPARVDRVNTALRETRDVKWARYKSTGKPEHRHDAVLADLRSAIVSALLSSDTKEGEAEFDKDETEMNLSALEKYDFKEWLRDVAEAHEETLASPLVNAAYNLTFSTSQKLSAASALAGALKFVNSQSPDILYYNLNSGMGEVVFTPLYLCLKNRGVQFRFFHQVEDITLAKDGSVASIRLRKQARLKGEGGGAPVYYDPLIKVKVGSDQKELSCWPTAPLEDQLAEPAVANMDLEAFPDTWRGERVELTAGAQSNGFDVVVLGLSIGVLEKACPSLVEGCPRLADMVSTARTTATQSAQLWFNRPPRDAKWQQSVMATCPPPFDTWADVSHLLAVEDWQPDQGPVPSTLIYLCGALPDRLPFGAPDADRLPPQPGPQGTVDERASVWLAQNLPVLWPSVKKAGPWSPPEGAIFDYIHESTHPSDRYVLSPPGQVRYRGEELGVRNLLIVGDWIRTYYNSGCIEAATRSGQAAAKILIGP